MATPVGLSIGLISLLATGCIGRFAIPSNANGDEVTYSDEQRSDESLRLIPLSLTKNQSVYAQARNCAIAFNEATRTSFNCDATLVALRSTALAAASWTVVSSSVAAALPDSDEMARRRWQYSTVAAGSIAAAAVGLDYILNCSERSQLQSTIAIRRAAALNNAARLQQCADHERRSGDLIKKVSKLYSGDVRKLAAEAGDGRLAADLLLNSKPVAVGDILADDTKRALAEAREQSVAAAKCADEEKTGPGDSKSATATSLQQRLDDRVNAILTECLASEYTPYALANGAAGK